MDLPLLFKIKYKTCKSCIFITLLFFFHFRPSVSLSVITIPFTSLMIVDSLTSLKLIEHCMLLSASTICKVPLFLQEIVLSAALPILSRASKRKHCSELHFEKVAFLIAKHPPTHKKKNVLRR